MKGMDSSDSEEEADAEKSSRRQQAEPQGDNTMQDADQPAESDCLLDSSNGSSKQPEMSIKSSTKRSSFEKFMAHSKKAFKKTVGTVTYSFPTSH